MRRRDKSVRQLQLPLAEPAVRELRAGEPVELSGVVLTARESGHRYLLDQDPPLLRELLHHGGIYHCGPVVRKMKRKEDWKIVAAGPSTSILLEEYAAAVIARYGVRVMIGAGGMGPGTLEACRQHGAVYLAAAGGAGSLLAYTVARVKGVSKLDFGIPEALWELEVRHFPALVAMDTHGESLYERVARSSEARYRELVF
jgi:tartrate/fumarate subfamily iron-sulfur-dependent hydro-lyase beta chain